MGRKNKKTTAAPAVRDVPQDVPSRRNLPAQARGLIAGVSNDITIPWYSGVLVNSDETLIAQGGGKGLAIYDEIKRDTHAYAMIQKRKMAVISRAWEVEPGGERPLDQEAAELVRNTFEALPFDRHCEDMLDATLMGFGVAEVVWGRKGNLIVPEAIVSHDQRRFAFDPDWRPRLLTRTDMREGIALPDRKFVVHRVGVKGNTPYGLGLGTRLFWPVLFKREGVAFWLHFLEKFAGPTVVGKVPYGTLNDEQNRLLNTLRDVRTSSAITVPIGTDVEFLEASRSGTVTYEQFLSYWDAQISICVTGETLTTQVGDGGGNRALGEVHQEQLDLLADSDADLLSDTLRDQLVRWIVEYNLPGAELPFVWRVRAKNEKAAAETRKTKADAAVAMDKAIAAVVRQAAVFEYDDDAREYITSFEVTDQLSDSLVNALVAARREFAPEPAEPGAMPGEPAAFSGAWLKKKR